MNNQLILELVAILKECSHTFEKTIEKGGIPDYVSEIMINKINAMITKVERELE